mmetsp:Transcript_43635/g.102592  ORF Transcript_43635/g.102592 Transcript_43635/m.102592 type:complete len:148 (+) Transcript_43635:115-558(+)
MSQQEATCDTAVARPPTVTLKEVFEHSSCDDDLKCSGKQVLQVACVCAPCPAFNNEDFITPPNSPPSSPRSRSRVDWRVPPKAPIRKTRARKSIHAQDDDEAGTQIMSRNRKRLGPALDFEEQVDQIFASKYQRFEHLVALESALNQ